MASRIIAFEEKTVYAVGDGVIIDRIVDSIDEAMLDKKGKKIPLLEIHPNLSSGGPFLWRMGVIDYAMEQHVIMDELSDYYRILCPHGPFGDVIQLTRKLFTCKPAKHSYVEYKMDFVAKRAFYKPGISADLALVVRDADGKLFVICIVRGRNPKKGEIAFPGGFINIEGQDMETAAECAVREAGEEMRVSILPMPSANLQFFSPNADNIRCFADFKNFRSYGKLRLVGSFFTSEDEILSDDGTKRVYMTTAYAILLPVNRKLTKVEVEELFIAGDDADKIHAIPLEQVSETKFAFEHHKEICDAMIPIIRQENEMY